MSALDKLNNRAKKVEEKPIESKTKKAKDINKDGNDLAHLVKKSEKMQTNEVIDKGNSKIENEKMTEKVNEKKEKPVTIKPVEEPIKVINEEIKEVIIPKEEKEDTSKKKIDEPKKRGRPRLEEKCRFTIYMPESKEDLLNLAMRATGKKANDCIVEAACKYFEENKGNFESIIKLKEQLNL